MIQKCDFFLRFITVTLCKKDDHSGSVVSPAVWIGFICERTPLLQISVNCEWSRLLCGDTDPFLTICTVPPARKKTRHANIGSTSGVGDEPC